MMRNKQPCRGFTLIELMVTLAIAAVLMLVAIPSMTAYKRNAELTSATNTLLSAINSARGEAMKRGMNAMVVPTGNGLSWNTGWVVFVDKDRTQVYDAAADQTVLSQGSLPSYFNITGNGTANTSAPYIMFDASGYSKTKSGGFGALSFTLTRTDLSGAQLLDQTRRIVVASTGRVRTCRPSLDATCTATASQ